MNEVMTKKEALKLFREEFPYTQFCSKVPVNITGDKTVTMYDRIARRQAWNQFTDSLCKEGYITLKQYESWVNPF